MTKTRLIIVPTKPVPVRGEKLLRQLRIMSGAGGNWKAWRDKRTHAEIDAMMRALDDLMRDEMGEDGLRAQLAKHPRRVFSEEDEKLWERAVRESQP